MADRGIKLAKDGANINSSNIDDYNLWTKYPPLTFLEKKTVTFVIDTSEGCEGVGALQSVPYDYDFIPYVIARVESDDLEEKYDLPADNFPIGGLSRCDMDHDLRLGLTYKIRAGFVDIDSYAYCQAFFMGDPNECISSNINLTVTLYFYMWRLGSPWPL